MTLNDFLQNRWYRVIVPAIIFVLIWVFLRDRFSLLDYSINKQRCETQTQIKSEELLGVLIMKYRDEKARNVRTIKCLVERDTIISEMFFFEGTDFYEYLKPGDSLVKHSQSLDLTVIRNEKDTVHHLFYGCKIN